MRSAGNMATPEVKVSFGYRTVNAGEKKRLDVLAARDPGVLSLKYVFSQVCSGKDNFLYRV